MKFDTEGVRKSAKKQIYAGLDRTKTLHHFKDDIRFMFVFIPDVYPRKKKRKQTLRWQDFGWVWKFFQRRKYFHDNIFVHVNIEERVFLHRFWQFEKTCKDNFPLKKGCISISDKVVRRFVAELKHNLVQWCNYVFYCFIVPDWWHGELSKKNWGGK